MSGMFSAYSWNANGVFCTPEIFGKYFENIVVHSSKSVLVGRWEITGKWAIVSKQNNFIYLVAIFETLFSLGFNFFKFFFIYFFCCVNLSCMLTKTYIWFYYFWFHTEHSMTLILRFGSFVCILVVLSSCWLALSDFSIDCRWTANELKTVVHLQLIVN